MSLHRKDLSDEKDPNPTKDQAYQQPERTEVELQGRDFADTNFGADVDQQGAARNSGPATRGNRSDDVQSSDRAEVVDGRIGDGDVSNRVEAARSQLDFERRTETGQND
jgi:hypothetical protein